MKKMIPILEQFLKRDFRKILIELSIVIVPVMGIVLVCHTHHQKVLEYDASVALFPAENYYANQQWEIALKGDNFGHIGFLDIIDEFRGTKTSNLAKAYSGICYFHLKKYKKALQLLKSYRSRDNFFSAQIIGSMGDCEINLGNVKAGIEHFKKAADKAGNSCLSLFYLKKALVVCKILKDYRSIRSISISMSALHPQLPCLDIVENNIVGRQMEWVGGKNKKI